MSNEQLIEALLNLTTEQLETIEIMVDQLNAHYSQDKRTLICINLALYTAA